MCGYRLMSGTAPNYLFVPPPQHNDSIKYSFPKGLIHTSPPSPLPGAGRSSTHVNVFVYMPAVLSVCLCVCVSASFVSCNQQEHKEKQAK